MGADRNLPALDCQPAAHKESAAKLASYSDAYRVIIRQADQRHPTTPSQCISLLFVPVSRVKQMCAAQGHRTFVEHGLECHRAGKEAA